MIKNEKGVTLVGLTITIIILFILSSIIINYSQTSTEINDYNNMIADITLLENKISIYYNKYGELPNNGTKCYYKSRFGNPKNDGSEYYKIDLSKLSDITLNYGKEEGLDYYVVNIQSHEVYYLGGIELNNKIYYSN